MSSSTSTNPFASSTVPDMPPRPFHFTNDTPSHSNITITSPEHGYLPIRYLNLQTIRKTNAERKQGLHGYNDIIKTIERMAEAEELMIEIERVTENVSSTLAIAEPFVAKWFPHLRNTYPMINASLSGLQHVKAMGVPNALHDIQVKLADELEKYKWLGIPEVAKHIDDIQRAYMTRDPEIYPNNNSSGRKRPLPADDEDSDKENDRRRPLTTIPPPPTPVFSQARTLTTTIDEEVDNITIFLSTYKPGPKPRWFEPEQGFQTIRQDGELDTEYWEGIMKEFMKRKATVEYTYKTFTVKMFRGGPDHAPFFIGQMPNNEGFIVTTTKKATAKAVVDGAEIDIEILSGEL